MVVEIIIRSYSLNVKLLADEEKSFIFINGKKIKYLPEEFIANLLPVINKWDSVMINNGVVDGGEYFIKIKNDGKERSIIGKNSFPINYNDFVKLINEVMDYE